MKETSTPTSSDPIAPPPPKISGSDKSSKDGGGESEALKHEGGEAPMEMDMKDDDDSSASNSQGSSISHSILCLFYCFLFYLFFSI